MGHTPEYFLSRHQGTKMPGFVDLHQFLVKFQFFVPLQNAGQFSEVGKEARYHICLRCSSGNNEGRKRYIWFLQQRIPRLELVR